MTNEAPIQYAVLNFDVHGDPRLYPLVYKEMGPYAISNYGSQSSCLINYAYKARFEDAMRRINAEAQKRGSKTVTFRIRRLHPDEAGEVREDSIQALKDLCARITRSLLDRIDRLEQKFNEKIDDVNEMIRKRNNAIAEARRSLDEARGLTMIFLVESEIENAVKAAQKIVDAQAQLRDALKEQYKDEIAAIRKAKREMEARS